jgi:hypothetical protein
MAVNTDHGLTFTHAKKASTPAVSSSSVSVGGEDTYQFVHGKKPGGKGGSYIFSPHSSHSFTLHGDKAGEDYFQSAHGAGYTDAKAAAKKWAAGMGHSRIHVQT